MRVKNSSLGQHPKLPRLLRAANCRILRQQTISIVRLQRRCGHCRAGGSPAYRMATAADRSPARTSLLTKRWEPVGQADILRHQDTCLVAQGQRAVRRPVAVISVRPKVTDLVFQLYGRSLHPELFQRFAVRRLERGRFTAEVAITGSGHVICWRAEGLTLTEVATSSDQPVPLKRRLLSHAIQGEQTDALECANGICYETCFQLERVRPDVFWTFQQELSADGITQGLFHRFAAGGRLAVGAVSWINIETRSRSLLVQAFHTFPDDFAIVKSQSIFQIP